MLEFDTITVCVLESGTDKTGLGRWCWVKLKGKNENLTLVVWVRLERFIILGAD